MVYYYEFNVEDKKSDKEEHTINIKCTRKWYFGKRGG